MMKHGLVRPETMSLDREMKLIFQYFDVDNSGYITADKIGQTMKKFLSIIPSENETKSMVHLVDFDKDGRISFAEFSSFYSECMEFTLPRVQEVEEEEENFNDDIFGQVVNEEHYVHYSGHGIVTQKEKYVEPKLKETVPVVDLEPIALVKQLNEKVSVEEQEIPLTEESENILKEETLILEPKSVFQIPIAPPLPKFYGNVQIKKLFFEKKKIESEQEIQQMKKKVEPTEVETETPLDSVEIPTEKVEMKESKENDGTKSICEEIKRLKGYFLEDIGEIRFYRGSSEPVPFYIQQFCNSFIGKEDYSFESKEHDLEYIQFGQEFALENFDEYQHLKEDDILIGDGDCLIVANMKDKQEDFDVYLVEDEESPASGPFKISQFLKTLNITYIPEEEVKEKEAGPPPPLYLMKSSLQQSILPVNIFLKTQNIQNLDKDEQEEMLSLLKLGQLHLKKGQEKVISEKVQKYEQEKKQNMSVQEQLKEKIGEGNFKLRKTSVMKRERK
jgi:hypothetical protein